MSALVQEGRRRAGVATEEPSTVDHAQYLTFMLGGESFAIGILVIKEIIEYGNVTVVPMMPEFIRGVINLRGAVVPVVDLSARFGRKPSETTRRTCIVIIEVMADGDRQDVGVIVDTVNAVLEIPGDQIEPPPTFGARIRTDFIRGMGKVNGKFVIILNVDKVLSVDDLAMLQQAGGNEREARLLSAPGDA
ncbi:chemotaxis protein CheW [Noviherbaspirillum sp.]|jgi:purine-binding chemotaxis protein CheW|uniref:chemotaxis protein CheW n=1 Tax=Noviherbaspirillum sp. TaxID=1926288 RepID=UPI0025D0F55F|nr:chemotaxis protein CheW [Noviherbaspirillum sp.]